MHDLLAWARASGAFIHPSLSIREISGVRGLCVTHDAPAGTPLVAMASRSLSSGPLPLPVLSIHPKQASDEPCSLRARNMRKAFSMRDADTAEAAHGQGGGRSERRKVRHHASG